MIVYLMALLVHMFRHEHENHGSRALLDYVEVKMLRSWQVANLAQAFNVQYSGQVEGLAKLARCAVGAQQMEFRRF